MAGAGEADPVTNITSPEVEAGKATMATRPMEEGEAAAATMASCLLSTISANSIQVAKRAILVIVVGTSGWWTCCMNKDECMHIISCVYDCPQIDSHTS